MAHAPTLRLLATLSTCAWACPAPAQMAWVQRTPNPGANGAYAMVFDSTRARAVLVEADGRVWERTVGAWERKEPATRPQGLASLALAYDPVRQRTVLAGSDATTTRLETWEWDGSTWSNRMPAASPAPRVLFAMAYDPARQRTVLAGGSAAANFADEWLWDGTTWTQQPVPGGFGQAIPCGLAYDGARSRLVMIARSASLQQTWEHDGTTWRLATAAAPSRVGVLVYDPVRQVTVFAADSGGGSFFVFTWNGSSWTTAWSSPIGVPGSANAGCFDPTAGSATFFTYYSHSFSFTSSEVTWDGSVLRIVQPSGPVWDPVRGRIVALAADGTSLLEWDGSRWQLRILASGPGFTGASLAHDRGRALLVAFGAAPGGSQLQTWECSGGSVWVRRTPTVQPQSFGAMAYDAARSRIVMLRTTSSGSETWEWDGTNWLARQPLHAPPRLAAPALVYDPVRGRCVLVGSDIFAPPPIGMWEWDGLDWTQRSASTGPSPRPGAAVAFDTARGRLVLHGGGFPPFTDTWEWDGATWTQRSPLAAPSPRSYGGMAFDERRGRCVLAGQSGDYLALDTQELVWPYDDLGPGHAAQPLPIACSANPVLAQSFCLSFTSPRGVAALMLSPTIPSLPALPVVHPVLCAPALFHPDPARLLALPIAGSGARICFTLPADPLLAFLPVTVQALVDAGCIQVTNGMLLRLQP